MVDHVISIYWLLFIATPKTGRAMNANMALSAKIILLVLIFNAVLLRFGISQSGECHKSMGLNMCSSLLNCLEIIIFGSFTGNPKPLILTDRICLLFMAFNCALVTKTDYIVVTSGISRHFAT